MLQIVSWFYFQKYYTIYFVLQRWKSICVETKREDTKATYYRKGSVEAGWMKSGMGFVKNIFENTPSKWTDQFIETKTRNLTFSQAGFKH